MAPGNLPGRKQDNMKFKLFSASDFYGERFEIWESETANTIDLMLSEMDDGEDFINDTEANNRVLFLEMDGKETELRNFTL